MDGHQTCVRCTNSRPKDALRVREGEAESRGPNNLIRIARDVGATRGFCDRIELYTMIMRWILSVAVGSTSGGGGDLFTLSRKQTHSFHLN